METLPKVALLASLNLGLGEVVSFVSGIEPILRDLVLLGQFTVAAVTAVYVLRKIRKDK